MNGSMEVGGLLLEAASRARENLLKYSAAIEAHKKEGDVLLKELFMVYRRTHKKHGLHTGRAMVLGVNLVHASLLKFDFKTPSHPNGLPPEMLLWIGGIISTLYLVDTPAEFRTISQRFWERLSG